MVRRCRTIFLLRLRQDHASIASHGEAEEVEALVDVDDPGLCFAQLQPSLSQKGVELGDDIGLQDLTRWCRHHKVVSIADQADAAMNITASAGWDVSTLFVLGSEEPFHAVERYIGQQR